MKNYFANVPSFLLIHLEKAGARAILTFKSLRDISEKGAGAFRHELRVNSRREYQNSEKENKIRKKSTWNVLQCVYKEFSYDFQFQM